MATDNLSIGATPAEESCEQVGTPNYNPEKASKECRVFANQLKRQFGEPPYGARIGIKSNPHDAGNYLEVVVYYNDNIEEAIDYAFKIEAESPANWDEEAKKELGL